VTLTLREATAEDLPAVGAMHQRSRVAAYSPFLPAQALADPGPEAMGAYWTERWRWERETHRMILAERAGRLVGFSYLGPDDEEDPRTGLLCALHLEPAERGRGTGRALMVDALAAIWVLAANAPARRFYERGGWRPVGEPRPEWWGGREVPQLRYLREL
jgi:GNAT superfamily N-acetyltransferase